MKVLHLNASDMGGAGRAVYRLHQGLKGLGINSQMLVQSKNCDDKAVLGELSKLGKLSVNLKLGERLDHLPLKVYRSRHYENFSLQWVPNHNLQRIIQCDPDIVNLHWVSHGFLSIEAIAKLNKPLVWTLHDMASFTGGCHYSRGCNRYTDSCGACHKLGSKRDWDLSRWVWNRKVRAWGSLDLTIVTPSMWLAECAQASSLFKARRVEVIPNGLDTQIYRPLDCQIARSRLNISSDKKLILFGALSSTSNYRKGFHLLQLALQELGRTAWQDQIELLVFGAVRPDPEPDFNFKAHYIGSLSDDITLSLVYAAADVFVAPSIQDNLPNTVMESLACGTPAVAFKIGGMPDLIEHHKTGYLASPFEIEDLVKGILWVLEDQVRHQILCKDAREKAEQAFSLELQARRYQSLFGELLSKN